MLQKTWAYLEKGSKVYTEMRYSRANNHYDIHCLYADTLFEPSQLKLFRSHLYCQLPQSAALLGIDYDALAMQSMLILSMYSNTGTFQVRRVIMFLHLFANTSKVCKGCDLHTHTTTKFVQRSTLDSSNASLQSTPLQW